MNPALVLPRAGPAPRTYALKPGSVSISDSQRLPPYPQATCDRADRLQGVGLPGRANGEEDGKSDTPRVARDQREAPRRHQAESKQSELLRSSSRPRQCNLSTLASAICDQSAARSAPRRNAGAAIGSGIHRSWSWSCAGRGCWGCNCMHRPLATSARRRQSRWSSPVHVMW